MFSLTHLAFKFHHYLLIMLITHQLLSAEQTQEELFELVYDKVRNELSIRFDLGQDDFFIYLYSNVKRHFSCSVIKSQLRHDNDVRLKKVINMKITEYNATECIDGICVSSFGTLPYGFYCCQKLRSEKYRTNLYTKTIEIKHSKGLTMEVPTTIQIQPEVIIVFVLIAILVTAIVIYFAYTKCVKHKNVANVSPSDQIGESDQSDVGLLSPHKKTNKIFIVYHRDDDHHFKMVVSLVQLLRTVLSYEVIVDYDCRNEKSIQGVTTWITNVVKECQKIIFVSSEMSHHLIKSITRSKNPQIPAIDHFNADFSFMFAWRTVVSSLELCYDYKKIYNVRFRSTIPMYLTSTIVPARHFVIPTHLTELLIQLTGGNSIDINSNDTYYKILQNSIRSSPFYSELVKAVLPSSKEVPIEIGCDDKVWISPGL